MISPGSEAIPVSVPPTGSDGLAHIAH